MGTRRLKDKNAEAEAVGDPTSAVFSGRQYLDRKNLSGRLTTYLSQCFGIGMSRAQVIRPTSFALGINSSAAYEIICDKRYIRWSGVRLQVMFMR